MKVYFLIILGLLNCYCFAQTENRAEYSVWQQQEATTAMVYANKANVRTEASISSQITDSLVAGDTIFINSITKQFYKQNGIYAPWAAVSYVKHGVNATGFLWLGAVAIGYATKDDQSFLFGIESSKKPAIIEDYGPRNIFEVKVKAVEKNTITAATTLMVPDDESFSYLELKLLGNPNLKNIKEVVRIMFGGEACGVSSNFHYFGLSTNKFLVLPTKYSVGDADVYYHSESLIFPNEHGGKPNKIIRYIEEEVLVSEATAKKKEVRKKSTKTETYNWNGVEAVLVKK